MHVNVPGVFCFAKTFGECKNCGSLAMFTAIRGAEQKIRTYSRCSRNRFLWPPSLT